MANLPDRTLDIEGEAPTHQRAPAPVPHLLLALECDRPLSLSALHRLGAGGTVSIGRGSSRDNVRRSDHRALHLEMRVPDARMSAAHARLDGALGRWTIADTGSRNGIRVNGLVVASAELRDGDLIELGHTLFIYREMLVGEGPEDIDVCAKSPAAHGLCTLNPRLRADFRKLVQLSRANVSILILGETGTGKEVTAQAVHRLSAAEGRFVGVNCGAIPESLIEAELFGSARGAFSGAVRDRPGLIRDAHGGTLFLDEIGDLPQPSQAAFLRVLQERRVRPVGGTESVPVDVRVVAATNQDVERLVNEGRFRNDLFARIAGFRLTLPPLRERREDLGILIGTLLRRIAGPRAEGLSFTVEAARKLFSYDFPLNVRELENWLTMAVALAHDGRVDVGHLPEPIQLRPPSIAPSTRAPERDPRPLTREQADHKIEVEGLLREHRGNVSAIARSTGKARNQIQRWLRRYGLKPEDFR